MPTYWEEAVAELTGRDAVLAQFIAAYEGAPLTPRGAFFPTLIRSIVGQQISVKAADTVWTRLIDCIGEADPQSILAQPHEALQACGLSHRKTEYIVGIATRFDTDYKGLDWQQMEDEEVIERLTELRGVGRWTAEMILIFSFLRPDVFPIDDLGVRRGMEQLYNSGAEMTRAELRAIADTWRPWRTVASWYMWRSTDVKPD